MSGSVHEQAQEDEGGILECEAIERAHKLESNSRSQTWEQKWNADKPKHVQLLLEMVVFWCAMHGLRVSCMVLGCALHYVACNPKHGCHPNLMSKLAMEMMTKLDILALHNTCKSAASMISSLHECMLQWHHCIDRCPLYSCGSLYFVTSQL